MSNVVGFPGATESAAAPLPAPAYAELAVTTNFSFLRGASHPKEFILQAATLGLTGIGIADRNSVAGVVRAYSALEEWNEHVKTEKERIGLDLPTVRLIVGARLVFADRTPDILAYPQNRAAWGRLTRLLTVGKSRGEKAECILFFDDLIEHIAGLNLIVMPPVKVGRNSRSAHSRGSGNPAFGSWSPLSGERAGGFETVLTLLTAASPRHVWLAAGMLDPRDDTRRLLPSKASAHT